MCIFQSIALDLSSDGRNIKDFFTADLNHPIYRGKYTLTVYVLLSIYKYDDCVDSEIFTRRLNVDKGRGPREFVCKGSSRQFLGKFIAKHIS